MIARAFCLMVLGRRRLSIHQALASRAAQQFFGAGDIVHAQR
jgi:hypothetical protein